MARTSSDALEKAKLRDLEDANFKRWGDAALARNYDPYREPRGYQSREAAAKIERQRREYTGPQTISNPYYIPSEGDDVATPSQQHQDEVPFWLRVNAGEGSPENTAVAQKLLDDGNYKSASHKRRLEDIVRTGATTERTRQRLLVRDDAKEQARQTALSDYQHKKLVDYAATRKNGMSISEANEVHEDIERNRIAGTAAPRVSLVAQGYMDEDDPVVASANASDALTAFMKDPQDSNLAAKAMQSLIGGVDKDGKLDRAQVLNAVKWIQETQVGPGGTSSSQQRMVNKDALNQAEKDVEDFRFDSSEHVFDAEGNFKDRPSSGVFSSNTEAKNAYDIEMKAYRKLLVKRDKFKNQLFARATGTPPPSGGGVVFKSKDKGTDNTATLNTAVQAATSKDTAVQASGDDFIAAYKRAQELSRELKVPLFVKDTESGQTHKVE